MHGDPCPFYTHCSHLSRSWGFYLESDPSVFRGRRAESGSGGKGFTPKESQDFVKFIREETYLINNGMDSKGIRPRETEYNLGLGPNLGNSDIIHSPWIFGLNAMVDCYSSSLQGIILFYRSGPHVSPSHIDFGLAT